MTREQITPLKTLFIFLCMACSISSFATLPSDKLISSYVENKYEEHHEFSFNKVQLENTGVVYEIYRNEIDDFWPIYLYFRNKDQKIIELNKDTIVDFINKEYMGELTSTFKNFIYNIFMSQDFMMVTGDLKRLVLSECLALQFSDEELAKFDVITNLESLYILKFSNSNHEKINVDFQTCERDQLVH